MDTPNKAKPKLASQPYQTLSVCASTVPKKAHREPIKPRMPVASGWRRYSPTSPSNNSASPTGAITDLMSRLNEVAASGLKPKMNRLVRLMSTNSAPAATAARPPHRMRFETDTESSLCPSFFSFSRVNNDTKRSLAHPLALKLWACAGKREGNGDAEPTLGLLVSSTCE